MITATKIVMLGSIHSFLLVSDFAPTCNGNFIIVLQEFASVSILELNGLGAFPA